MKVRLPLFVPQALALFRERPNRFLAIVDIISPGREDSVKVHVHDPGRLPDLLLPENEVLLRRARRLRGRKTSWDLIAAKAKGHWVLSHSGLHRGIVEKILATPEISPFGPVSFRPEPKRGRRRLDFLLTDSRGQRIWLEVKGCTLAKGSLAIFPDAPTSRGASHLEELISIREAGERAAILILVFRPEARAFAPCGEVDPRFAALFFKALSAGVEAYPLLLEYLPEEGALDYRGIIPVVNSNHRSP
ncbi:DNA/RNA nuclease SfsA [Thermosulfuriphilus sp.]